MTNTGFKTKKPPALFWGLFLFTFSLISDSPAIIPLVEASLFIGTPLDEVRREHELEITVTAALMNDVIILEPFYSAIERFGVEIKRLGEIFLGSADKTCLLMNIESKPEENAQSSGLRGVFQQIVTFIEVESHASCLRSKMVYSGRCAFFHFNIIVSVLQQ